MASAVVGEDAEALRPAPILGAAEQCQVRFVGAHREVHGRRQFPAFDGAERRSLHGLSWRMPDRREFLGRHEEPPSVSLASSRLNDVEGGKPRYAEIGTNRASG